MLLYDFSGIVLYGDAIEDAKQAARESVTFARWAASDPFNPVRVDGKTFRNVSDWRRQTAENRVNAYLLQAAGLPAPRV